MSSRVILYHKQATSARIRFLKFSYHSVLAFSPLAKLAQVMEGQAPDITTHIPPLLQQLSAQLALQTESLQLEPEFQQYVDVPGEPVQIILVKLTTIDPPFAQAKQIGAQFIDLMQARGLPQVELELLRNVYEWALGG